MGDDLRKGIAEFIGVFALVFFGAGSIITNELTGGAVGLLGIAIAHAFALGLMINATGHISGGHINPAVTIAFLATRRIPLTTGVIYIIAQLLGGVAAGFLLQVIFPEAAWKAVSLGTPLVNTGVISVGTAILVEAILTFFLVFAVFGTAGDPAGPKGIAGFGIGLVLLFDILVGGPLTGASMNPARTFGPAVAGMYWDNHFVYWVGPVAGALVAGILYYYVLQKAKA